MNSLSKADLSILQTSLKKRFEMNMHRHPEISWDTILHKLESGRGKLESLYLMEETGGEPDVLTLDQEKDWYAFVDCSVESPGGRRSLCYDHKALEERKEHKPKDSALNMAKFMGIELLDEGQYMQLQKYGAFDTKTSSWIKTPDPVRKLGGAIFGDYRYGRVFFYHNGASSYYAARGFRGLLRI